MDNYEFIFLKKWAGDIAWDISFDENLIMQPQIIKKVKSIILESMSPAKGWKTR